MNRVVLTAVLLVGLAILAAVGYSILNGGAPPQPLDEPQQEETAPASPEPGAGPEPLADAEPTVAAPPETGAERRVIMGVVTDAATLEPIAGAVVTASAHARPGDDENVAETRTEGSGAFELAAFPLAKKLSCRADGYVTVRRDLDSGAARVDFSLQPAATLAGRVLDRDTGDGVASVGVRVYDPSASVIEIAQSRGDMPSTETGAGGEFLLADVVPGTYRLALECRSEGYLPPEEPVIVRLRPRQSEEDVEIVLRRGGVVRGTVTDEEGSPVDGVNVNVLPADFMDELTDSSSGFERFSGFAETTDTTDPDGVYVIQGLDLDKALQLTAREGGYAATSGGVFTLTVEEPSRVIDLTMLRGSTVSGRVVDAAGKPVPGKEVLISPDLESLSGNLAGLEYAREVEAGEDGGFEFTRVPAGKYAIRSGGFQRFRPAMTEAGRNATVRIEVDGVEDLSGVEVTALAGEESEELALDEGVITGTVIDPEGQPAGGVRVSTQTAEMGPRGNRDAVTGEDGAFELQRLPLGGTFELTVTSSAGWAEAQAKTGDEVTLRMSPPTRIAGIVLSAKGELVEGCAIRLKSAGEESAGPMESLMAAFQGGRSDAETDSNGAFEINNAAPGRYMVHADSERQGTGEIGPLDLRPGQQLENLSVNLLPGVTVSGMVTDRSGAPISGAEVSLVAGGQPDMVRLASSFAGGMLTQKEAVRTTDRSGRFTMDNVAPGSYELTASRGGYAPARKGGVTVRAGSDLRGLNLTLSQGGAVNGRILVDGEIKPNVRVMLMGAEGVRMAATDEQGRFSVDALPEGSYMVAGLDLSQMMSGDPQSMNAIQPRVVDVVDGTMQELDLGSRNGAPVSGYVDGLSGNYSQVALRIPGGPDPSTLDLQNFDMQTIIEMVRHQTATGTVNPDGSFSLPDVPPGEYILEAYSMDMGEAMRDPFGFMQSGAYEPVVQQYVTVGQEGLNVNVVAPTPAP